MCSCTPFFKLIPLFTPLLMHRLSPPSSPIFTHSLRLSLPHTLRPSFLPVHKVVRHNYDRSSFSTMQVHHKFNQVSVVHDFFSTLCSCICGFMYTCMLHRMKLPCTDAHPPKPSLQPLTALLAILLLLPSLSIHHSCTFCPSPSHTFPPLTHSPRTAVTIFHMMHGIPKDETFFCPALKS